MNKTRMIKKQLFNTNINLENKKASKFPYNGSLITKEKFSFSFSSFDRTHELFNLGDNSETNNIVKSEWFLDFLDCLKSVNNMNVNELKRSMFDLHPIDFSKTNVNPPDSEQKDYWQFRINKSKGRIIGFLVRGIFYVVWLDPHHNLTNSEGYGKMTYHMQPLSMYEQQLSKISELEEKVSKMQEDINTYEELLNEK